MEKSFIPYGRQTISAQDIQAVVDVLQSDWLTQGPSIDCFEQAVAAYCGATYAVAVNSATSALHIACLAAGLGKGDRLWTSPNTFVASANCALYCGATIDFVDIDPRTYNLSADELAKKLASARCAGTLPKVVVPVHFAGQSCEMDRIAVLAREYGFTVIEDASHAIGGKYHDAEIGSCTFSDMAVFSFHPVKIITTGEGGMVVTNNRQLYENLLLLRNHGITRDPLRMQGECHGPWYYQQIDLGFNYRMTDLQAALGLSQLKRLDEFVSRRQMLTARYNAALLSLPVITPWHHHQCYSSCHLYVIQLKTDHLETSHRQIFEELRQAGIGVNLHYIPVHLQPFYQQFGYKKGDYPVAEHYYEHAVSLPLFFALTCAQQDFIVDTLQKVLR